MVHSFEKNVTDLKAAGDEAASLGCQLEVHVAEKTYADALRSALQERGVKATTVLHTPVR